MQAGPLISIVIPVYNVEEYLRAAVDSAVNQTYENKEIILVDDGSTDKSGEICDEYAATYPCIKVIHQPNGGLSAARNTGIKNSTGKYIAFLDSDDEYGDNTMVEHYLSIFQKKPEIEILQFPTMEYKNQGNFELRGRECLQLDSQNKIMNSVFYGPLACTVWDKIFRKDLFENHHFTENRFFEDIWLMTDLLQTISHIYICDFGYYKYKIREGSITQCKFSLKKCRQNIETNLKMLSLMRMFQENDLAYIRNFILMQNSFISYCNEYTIKDFKDVAKIINKHTPTIMCMLRNLHNVRANNLAKTVISRYLGIETTFQIYQLKNK